MLNKNEKIRLNEKIIVIWNVNVDILPEKKIKLVLLKEKRFHVFYIVHTKSFYIIDKKIWTAILFFCSSFHKEKISLLFSSLPSPYHPLNATVSLLYFRIFLFFPSLLSHPLPHFIHLIQRFPSLTFSLY